MKENGEEWRREWISNSDEIWVAVVSDLELGKGDRLGSSKEVSLTIDWQVLITTFMETTVGKLSASIRLGR
ncbi:hypothetical protein BLOT_007332 [Blomia tropicalis]|nr:hypothetical protein BLOT_007332 [Blomia tropicalis]